MAVLGLLVSHLFGVAYAWGGAVSWVIGFLSGLLWGAMVLWTWNQRASGLAAVPASEPPAPQPVELTPAQRLAGRPLLGAVVLATAVLFFVAVENMRGAGALKRTRNDLRAQGFPLTMAEVLPPAVPEDQNLAMAPVLRPLMDWSVSSTGRVAPEGLERIQAANALVHQAMRSSARPGRDDWREGKRLDFQRWRDAFRETGALVSPEGDGEPAADVLAALRSADPLLTEIRAAVARRPAGRFPIDYDAGWATLLPHLAEVNGLSRVISLRAAALLGAGRADQAVEDLVVGLRLSDVIRQDPSLICLLTGIAMDIKLLQPVWEGCLDHRWTEEQAARLQAVLAARDYKAEAVRAFHGERVVASAFYDDVAAGRVDPTEFVDSDGADPLGLLRLTPRGWIRQNQVRHLRFVSLMARELQDASSDGELPDFDAMVLSLKPGPYTALARRLMPALTRVASKVFEAEAMKRLGIVGLGLERHRLAHGGYPESLDALVPAFLEQVPPDPMIGQPLRYVRTPDGYRLRSVGWDHDDDGGAYPKRNRTDGDLVWR